VTPEKIGKYIIEGEIGKGGMGSVYLGADPETDQRVAIKVLTPQLAQDPTFLNRFRREISTLQKLNHPNIVRMIEAGELDGTPYYVMEYIEGDSLDEELERLGRIPLERSIHIVKEVARALDYSHQMGVIHRDIKPANILLGLDGGVRLTDFGIAKVLQATRMTRTGGILGTAEYMSPEQAEGRVLDRRSDIYSLGVVFYRMLTGRPPFTGTTAIELLKAHRYDLPESPKEYNPDLPGSIVNLIMEDMLAKNPSARIATAQALVRKLELIEKRLPSGGREGERELVVVYRRPLSRLFSWIRAHIWSISAAAFAVALIVAGAYWFRTRPSDAQRLYEEGIRLKTEGNLKEAGRQFRYLRNLYPRSNYATLAGKELLEIEKGSLEIDLGKMALEQRKLADDLAAGYAIQDAARGAEAGDVEKAARMLEAVLLLFPKSRFAGLAQHELEKLRNSSTQQESSPRQEEFQKSP